MPYLYIHCELEPATHPNATIIGEAFKKDEPTKEEDKEIIKYLKAEQMPVYNSKEKYWESPNSPEEVLNLLEKIGYKLVSSCCNKDTIHWTLWKD